MTGPPTNTAAANRREARRPAGIRTRRPVHRHTASELPSSPSRSTGPTSRLLVCLAVALAGAIATGCAAFAIVDTAVGVTTKAVGTAVGVTTTVVDTTVDVAAGAARKAAGTDEEEDDRGPDALDCEGWDRDREECRAPAPD